jgi:hypothetical protein
MLALQVCAPWVYSVRKGEKRTQAEIKKIKRVEKGRELLKMEKNGNDVVL